MAKALLWGALLVSSLVIIIGVLSPSYGIYGLLGILLGSVAYFAPRACVWVLAAALPLFGNRATTPQYVLFLLFLAGISGGLALRSLRQNIHLKELPLPLYFLSLFVVTGLLSLSSLPLCDLLKNGWTITSSTFSAFSTLDIARHLAEQALTVPENFYTYSFLEAALFIFAWVLGVSVWSLARSDEKFAKTLLYSVLIGVLISFVGGFADYYGLIDLRSMRALDPTVNKGNVGFRMQSFFGHSGWFAEYITLAIPSVLVLLLLPTKFSIRVALVLALLIIGELALILTFQRGGWLSYPLTLGVVWAAIYLIKGFEKGDKDAIGALKRSFIKIIVSLPLTVLGTVLLIYLGSLTGVFSSPATKIDKYLNRAKDITKTSDRTDFIQAGFLLGGQRPFFGGGLESFAYRFEEEFVKKEGAYVGRFKLPLHGSAHNVYAQTVAGTGYVGLTFLLLAVGSALFLTVKNAITSKELLLAPRLILLAGGVSSAAFLIYGNVQEIFYIPSLLVLVFVLMAVSTGKIERRIEDRSHRRIIAVFVTLFAAHLVTQYSFEGKGSMQYERSYGCYENEGGRAWCGPYARTFLKADSHGEVRFKVRGAPSKSMKEISYSVNDGERIRVNLNPGEEKEILVRTSDGAHTKIELFSSAVFIPAREMKHSQDRRVLSFQLEVF